MNSNIVRKEAKARVEIDDYCRIVGKFLVRYGDPADDQHCATVHLIEGCKYLIGEIAEILQRQFPQTSHVSVRDEENLDAKHIDLEWSEMEYIWFDHDHEFEERVIRTLKTLSRN